MHYIGLSLKTGFVAGFQTNTSVHLLNITAQGTTMGLAIESNAFAFVVAVNNELAQVVLAELTYRIWNRTT